jgi:hypothetical protein
MPRLPHGLRAGILLALCCLSARAQTSPSASQGMDGNRPWVDNTSGPFFTGTADVMPQGSFYIEGYYFNYRTRGSANTTLPLKAAYGIGHRLELDAYTAFEYVGAGGIDGTSFQFGDTVPQLKLELYKEKDRYRLWRMPSLGLSFDVNIPTGHLQSAKPNLAGGAQTTNDTWNEQVNLLARKQFNPFELYLEASEIVQNPVNIVGPYQFDNGLTNVSPGTPYHVVDGNVVSAAGAFEHVLRPKSGLGYLLEFNGERQTTQSLFFGRATAPSFSYFNINPEIEYTRPSGGKFPITWAAGVGFTAARSGYPRQLIPMFTVTLNGDLHGGR